MFPLNAALNKQIKIRLSLFHHQEHSNECWGASLPFLWKWQDIWAFDFTQWSQRRWPFNSTLHPPCTPRSLRPNFPFDTGSAVMMLFNLTLRADSSNLSCVWRCSVSHLHPFWWRDWISRPLMLIRARAPTVCTWSHSTGKLFRYFQL